MHLKQQHNLLINKIWTTENFRQEASFDSLSYYPVLGNKKVITKKSANQILHSDWLYCRCFGA